MLMSVVVEAQVQTLDEIDSLQPGAKGGVGVGGFVDAYYGYNSSQPPDGNNPYFVSSARHNELTINLAYVDIRYRSSRARARLAPAFGTYMDANYATEPGTLRNFLEASIGVLLDSDRGLWLDAGVLSTPFGIESPVSRDHLMYTRSFSSENVPYYVSGVRLSMPLSEKVDLGIYLVNGWQVIQDNNSGKSLVTEISYRAGRHSTFYWNNYLGDERSPQHPDFRTRYFTDVTFEYASEGKWAVKANAYAGVQERSGQAAAPWWQACAVTRYSFTRAFSLSGRVEYFHDPESAIITSVTGTPGFKSGSFGLCANWRLYDHALFRVEARHFFAPEKVYIDSESNPAANSRLLIASLTAWF